MRAENGHTVYVTKSKKCPYCGEKLNKNNEVFERYVPYDPASIKNIDAIINKRMVCSNCHSKKTYCFNRLMEYDYKICDFFGVLDFVSQKEYFLIRQRLRRRGIK